ncbi:MAG: tetratricopeptide repeat protein [Nitrospinae bacterium]|nr:tetratricopeptide repeat protein [Nitrospinota bacterium]
MDNATPIHSEYRRLRESCGYFSVEDQCLVSASGKDTFKFLQSQTTNDILALKVGQGQNSAVTDRKARLLAAFSAHRNSEDSVLFLLEKTLKRDLLECLNAYLFREDVKFSDELRQDFLLAIQGPKSALVLQNLDGALTLPEKPNDIAQFVLEGEEVLIVNKSLTGEEGFILCFNRLLRDKMVQLAIEAGKKHGITPIRPETREILRIEAGIPIFGKDMDSKNILPETGLEHTSVSYNKGCYIGQEVIARVKTYGAPAGALMGLVFEGESLPPSGSEMRMNGRKIGAIRSGTFSHALGKNVALAYLQKEFRSPDAEMDVVVNERSYRVKTVLLPFYQAPSRNDHALVLLGRALKHYKEEDDLEKPIALLREAIDLAPKLSQAYEALGVLLSKQGKLDEAISLMKRLAEIDPREIMAHANLSIYYMKQGRVEDAENEKAEAAALQFEKIVSENMAKKAQKLDEEKRRAERENKIGMFKKVLEIDPADQVANFGLGSIYLEMGRYEEALQPLRVLVETYKDYSAAYLLLGKTLEKSNAPREAVEIYRKGIAAASKKGDLMPLKEMQTRMNQLLHSVP